MQDVESRQTKIEMLAGDEGTVDDLKKPFESNYTQRQLDTVLGLTADYALLCF